MAVDPPFEKSPSMVEKGVDVSGDSISVTAADVENKPTTILEKIGYWAKKLDSYGFESRGIQRVQPEERTKQNWLAICLVWSSAGLNLSSFSMGFTGPYYYNLSLPQTIGIIWGVGALGSICSAYMATFGKRNGLRALVSSRFAFGWYGSMVMAFLNGFTEVSFGILDCILGGQALQTVSQGRLPLSVAIIIISALSWIIAFGGYKFIHMYGRVAFVVPLISFLALYATGGPKFTTAQVPEPSDAADHSGFSLTFIAIIFGGFAGWIPVSGDYYIYFPESTSDWKIFITSFFGIWVLPSFATTCGAGFASAALYNTNWADTYDSSVTDFVALALEQVGTARYFLVFLLGWSLISNNMCNLYSIGISVQLLGDWAMKIPRFFWTFCASVLITILSVVGRNSFSTVLSNLMALIGYWSIIYFGIFVIEYSWIRRRFPLDLDAWNDPKKLPPGYAAGLAFCFGIMGSVLGMCQTWYTGKIGVLIGSYGGDLGLELGFLFSALVYPVFRYVEFQRFGR
ncbi:permease for cytosine/purines, uracil, thiamine, allantoin-domain-containing protein [Xylariales sp. PMI_506]|nr:permease for cytosine/purines, uracil, thiamine, allantoin-domain-containing protein [Xylariales sp. PMI_506]